VKALKFFFAAAVLVVVCLAPGERAAAQAARLLVVGGQPVYVQDLQLAGTQQKGSSGVLGRMRASREQQKSARSAAAVSEAIVREMNNRGIPAHHLTAQQAMPRAGLLVSGVFSEKVPHGLFSSLSSLGSSSPNTEVTLTVSDLTADPNTAVARLGTNGTLKGQGSAVSFNPYAVAVKFVVNKAESASSIDALAKKIVAEMLQTPT
jgi:hypothetical protein